MLDTYPIENCKIVERRAMAVWIETGDTETYTDDWGNERERNKRFWLPLSKIEIDGPDSRCTITVPEWIAEREGIV